MNNRAFNIKSKIELKFNNSEIRDIAFNAFSPDLIKSNSRRSNLSIEKEDLSLVFYIDSEDITAFRASINDVISFGKVIENTLKLCQ
jgi:tRNA threonylcarbamoyladenosine modification (KEOPS) complex  Pcc1 subunit